MADQQQPGFFQGMKQGAGRIAGQQLAQRAMGAMRDFNDAPVSPIAGSVGGSPVGGGAAAGGEAAGAAAGGEALAAEALPLAAAAL